MTANMLHATYREVRSNSTASMTTEFLVGTPAQDDGPVNSLPKPYVDVGGEASSDYTRTFTHKELSANGSAGAE